METFGQSPRSVRHLSASLQRNKDRARTRELGSTSSDSFPSRGSLNHFLSDKRSGLCLSRRVQSSFVGTINITSGGLLGLVHYDLIWGPFAHHWSFGIIFIWILRWFGLMPISLSQWHNGWSNGAQRSNLRRWLYWIPATQDYSWDCFVGLGASSQWHNGWSNGAQRRNLRRWFC